MATVIDCYKTGASDESVQQFGFDWARKCGRFKTSFSLSTKELKYSSSYGVKVSNGGNAADG